MVVRTLDAKRDPFRPNEDEEEISEPEVPYLSAIGALLYLAQCTRPDISFSVNLLARYSNAPAHKHWNGVKDIFRYLKDAGYLSDPHRARSQTGSIFTIGDTVISWKSTKQTLVVTSSNHVEILALHEASRECFWLRELKKGYIKGDNTKYIAPKFFYSHQKQQHQNIEVKQIRSQENLADLFTKLLPKSTFQKLVQGIGMRKLSELNRL
ncbi:hypothetical protein FF2_025280 [Malus domestica]